MLRQLAELENSQEDGPEPVITAEELRAQLPAAFVDQLDEFDELVNRQKTLSEEFSKQNESTLQSMANREQQIHVLHQQGQMTQEEVFQEIEDMSQELERLVPEELKTAIETADSLRHYRAEVEGPPGKYGVYVDCLWGGGFNNTLSVRVGNFVEDEKGNRRPVGTDYDRADAHFVVGQNGIKHIGLGRFRQDGPRHSEGGPEQTEIKRDTAELLAIASQISAGEYADVLEYKYRLWLESRGLTIPDQDYGPPLEFI